MMLFGNTLPNVKIVYSRRAHSGGHFAPDRFTYRGGNGGREHELSLNPDAFVGKNDEWIVSILPHEMVHLWQHIFGVKKRKKYSYHDREWADKMESLGLMPSNTGMANGKRTGQRMSHFIIAGGLYQQAFEALAATGWQLHLESTAFPVAVKKPDDSKTKFVCPSCDWIIRAKPDTQMVCKNCLLDNLANMSWFKGHKAEDIITLIDGKTMLPPTNPPVADKSQMEELT